MSITEDDIRKASEVEDTEEPAYSASEILEKIQAAGGRIYRGRELVVFCLIQDRDVLRWLLLLGAKLHAGGRDGYRRSSDGPIEYDLYLHIIPTSGEQTWWEAAGPYLSKAR